MSRPDLRSRLDATREAFDSVAADYDGPRGNNTTIQHMRQEIWRCADATFAPGSRLLDLGCGTGLDAVRMAQMGHKVTATDWSPQMVQKTRDRAEREHLANRIQAIDAGAHEFDRLAGDGAHDGVYSNFGPLNCVPNLSDVSRECARLLAPGGAMVVSVIGRICPWEISHYLRRRNWARVRIRFARTPVPVRMNNHTIWTRYYSPREFYRPFARHFRLEQFRGLCLFVPPPYLTGVRERHPAWYAGLWHLDRCVSSWPVLRGMGDHFLMVMRKR